MYGDGFLWLMFEVDPGGGFGGVSKEGEEEGGGGVKSGDGYGIYGSSVSCAHFT